MAGVHIIILGLMVALVSDVTSVEILSMDVPSVVEAGSGDIILDCDFKYTEEEKSQLDIKWYFNNDPNPIFQWLPGRVPQIISDQFKKHLDVAYEVDDDIFTKHRALRIMNPEPQFSGNYRCKVSSFVDEDFNQKELLVYAPPSSIQFEEIRFSETDPLNVTCVAIGMYPLPTARIMWGHNSSLDEHESTSAVTFMREDGLVDVRLSTIIDTDQLAVQVTIGCEISLPGTEYTIQEHTIFYPKGMEPTTTTTMEPTTTTEAPTTTEEPSTTVTVLLERANCFLSDSGTVDCEGATTTEEPITTTEEPGLTVEVEAVDLGSGDNETICQEDDGSGSGSGSGDGCQEGVDGYKIVDDDFFETGSRTSTDGASSRAQASLLVVGVLSLVMARFS